MAAAQAASRWVASSVGDGASSITFWCRRCSVHSRSNSDSRLPWLSPIICTSIWRGVLAYFFFSIRGSPEAGFASRLGLSVAGGRPSAERTTRPRRSEQDGAVGHRDMQGVAVGLGINRDGAQAHGSRRADDTAGDLAAVGDQERTEAPVEL